MEDKFSSWGGGVYGFFLAVKLNPYAFEFVHEVEQVFGAPAKARKLGDINLIALAKS